MTRSISRPIKLLVIAILAIPVLEFGSFAADWETPQAITNATIVPSPGRTIEHGTILIDRGRIVAVGDLVGIPVDAEVLDASGLWAYPGFIDATSHLGISDALPSEEELARLRDAEQDPGQGPRTSMQRANRKGIWPHRSVRDLYVADAKKASAYRKQGFTTALLSPHPAILGGKGDVVQLSGLPLRQAELKAGATQIVAYGGNINSSFRDRGRYPGSLMGVVALLRQSYLDAEWYRQRQAQSAAHPLKLERPPSDPVLEAMGALIDGKETWFFLANTPSEIHHALDLAREFNQKIVILGGKEAWKLAGRLAEEEVSVVVSPEWDEKPKLKPKKRKKISVYATASWNESWEDDFFEPAAARETRVEKWEEQVKNIKTLLDHEIDVAVTSRDLKGAKELIENLRTALEHDLSSEEALDLLTLAPAKMLGVDDQIGTISPGKLANLTLWTKPLEEKGAEVRHTLVEGIRFDFTVGAPDEEEDETGDEEGDEGDESEEDGDEGEEEEESEESDAEEKHTWEIETDEDRAPPLLTGGNIVLRNAIIVTGTGSTLHNSDIFVENGTIKSIGKNLNAPLDTKVLDLSGYWIGPGLIDPHSHLAARAINEGSQSITSEVRIADVIDHTQLNIHRALAGGVTTIHTMHGSANSMGGQNAVMKLKYNTSPKEMHMTHGPRIVKFALGENVTRSRTIQRFPNTRMGVESVMRQGFNDALEYRKAWETYAQEAAAGRVIEMPRRDLRLEALNDILKGNIWVHSHSYRADEILRLLNVAQDYGFRIATLQHVLEGYRVMPEMLNHGVGGSTFSDWWGYKKEAYDAIPYNAAMMFKMGITASINSDSPDTIRYLNLEAAKSMRFGGLTADEALRLATINPAIQIGRDDRIGSIELGKDGDFAVYDGHPMDTFAKNVMTLIEGDVWFSHPSIDLDDIQQGPDSDFVPSPPRAPIFIPTSGEDFYAIVGATIHPVTSDPIEDGVIVMRDGLITAVGASFTPPTGATVVEAKGLHVYPGLVNAFTQVGLQEINSLAVTLDNSDIADFQPEIRSMSAVNPFSNHIGVARAEGITTAGVFPTGGIICGRGGLIQLDGWSMPEMLRRDSLGLTVNLPSIPARYTNENRKERLESHEKAIKKLEEFVQKAQHYARVKALDLSLTTDIRTEAMGPYVKGEGRVFLLANTYKEILEAIRFAETFEFDPVIVGAAEAWKCADVLAEKGIPVIVTGVYTRPVNPLDPFDAFYSNPAKLEARGVEFCIATGGSAYARRLGLNAGMAVAHGLDRDKAIASITIDAARILGVDDYVGSLEVGKTADVIITTGHPAQASTRTVGMFLESKPTKLVSLHEEHYRKWNKRPDPGLEPTGDLRGPPPMRMDTE